MIVMDPRDVPPDLLEFFEPVVDGMTDTWTLGPDPFAAASLATGYAEVPADVDHFAVFPKELARRCIAAGSSERGCCPACGAGWARVVERERRYESGSGRAGNLPSGKNGHGLQGGGGVLDVRRGPVVDSVTAGWSPACRCDAGDPVPATVLDPFAGAGTTGLVADRLGRSSVLIELNPEYAAMARARIVGDAPLFANVAD